MVASLRGVLSKTPRLAYVLIIWVLITRILLYPTDLYVETGKRRLLVDDAAAALELPRGMAASGEGSRMVGGGTKARGASAGR